MTTLSHITPPYMSSLYIALTSVRLEGGADTPASLCRVIAYGYAPHAHPQIIRRYFLFVSYLLPRDVCALWC